MGPSTVQCSAATSYMHVLLASRYSCYGNSVNRQKMFSGCTTSKNRRHMTCHAITPSPSVHTFAHILPSTLRPCTHSPTYSSVKPSVRAHIHTPILPSTPPLCAHSSIRPPSVHTFTHIFFRKPYVRAHIHPHILP
jgi:hypothetical protein